MKKRLLSIVLGIVLILSLCSSVFGATGENNNGITVLYKCGEVNDSTNSIRMDLKVKNNKSSDLDIANIKIRYWFTNDTSQDSIAECYYAQIGVSNVVRNFVQTNKKNANTYLEVGFAEAAGVIKSGNDSGTIQLTVHTPSYLGYTQANDYSFDSNFRDFGENSKITVYENDVLIYGDEPEEDGNNDPNDPNDPNTQTEKNFKVLYECAEDSEETSSISMKLKVVNTGNTDLDLSKITIKYLYTKDSNNEQIYSIPYAILGSSKIICNFVPLQETTEDSNTAIVVGFNDGTGVLKPNTDTGEIKIDVHKKDWIRYKQLNDYSFDGSFESYGENTKIVGYYEDELIFGMLPPPPAPLKVPVKPDPVDNPYEQKFLDMWWKIHNPENGYFSEKGIPYHSIETLIVEAPDYGHESTSEAFSYYIWLEAMYGKITGDWSWLEEAWRVTEEYIIPDESDQPGVGAYTPSKPATYAAEYPLPSYYPAKLEKDGYPVGQDPIAKELQEAYGDQVYGMHWLLDVDNFYGFGDKGDGVSKPSLINTFQRGEQESCWETVPHPSWEEFVWGGENGFLDLFTGDTGYTSQWRYTIASDADARVVQTMYWADKWAKEQGNNIDNLVQKAVKMGDFLRIAMFDKYFRPIGCEDPTAAGSGYNSCHHLLGWYYAWGGGIEYEWSWRIGSSHCHFGYQNPMTAWVMSEQEDFEPLSNNGKKDWEDSFQKQLEFYTWLQSSNGAIAGGATNSYNGAYDKYPEGAATFYDMIYTEAPVYMDPPSNRWFGMQAWSMQRIAELYYETDNQMAKDLMDKWVQWIMSEIELYEDGTFAIPSTLKWSGQPDTWTGKRSDNAGLTVEVTEKGRDLGITGSLINTLCYYAAASGNDEVKDMAKELLTRMWNEYSDDKGIATVEERGDFSRFFDSEIYIPESFNGKMPNGDEIKPGVSFIDIRSKYREDPDFAKLEAAVAAGESYKQAYHRFWAQCDIALAYGTFGELFPDEVFE